MKKLYCIIIVSILLITCKNRENDFYITVLENKKNLNTKKDLKLESLYSSLIIDYIFTEPNDNSVNNLNNYTKEANRDKDSLNIYRANNFSIIANPNIPLNDPRFIIVNRSISYFTKNNKFYDAYLANFILAEMYLGLGYNKNAESYIYKALQHLEENENELAYEKILVSMTACNILYKQNKFDEAYNLLKTYENIYFIINRSVYSDKRIKYLESLYFNNVGVLANVTDIVKPEEKLDNLTKALKSVDTSSVYNFQRGTANLNMLIYKLRNDDVDSIEYYLNEFIKLREPYKNQPAVLLNLAEIPLYYLQIEKDTAKAIEYQKKLLDQNKKIDTVNLVSKKIYEQMILKSDSFSIPLYKDYLNTLGILTVKNNKNQIQNQKFVYTNEKLTQLNKNLEKSNFNVILLIGLCGIAFTLFFITTINRIRYKKILEKDKYLEQDEKAFELTLAYKNDIEENLLGKKQEIFMELHDGIINKLFSTRFLLHKNFVNNENIKKAENSLIEVKQNLIDISKNYNVLNLIFTKDSFEDVLIELIKSQPQSHINFEYICDRDLNWNLINPQLKFHIYRIIQELLQNIHKHSNASKATIEIKQVKQTLQLKVSDNGIGMKFNIENGIGYQNIQQRLKEINASIDINSLNGTTITIIIQL